MSLNHLILTQFKNYQNAQFDFHPEIQCLTGSNGAGKTNILDAIYLLCLGKSHFQSRDYTIIKWQKDFYRVEGHFGKDKIAVTYNQKQGKKISFNKKIYDRIIDHLGKNTVIFIGPDDIELINGMSLFRRRWMDVALCQVDKSYLHHLSTYTRLLRQRNAYLKTVSINHHDGKLIQSYNDKMISPGQELFTIRKRFLLELEKYIEEIYFNISGVKEKVKLIYRSDLSETRFEDLFKKTLQHDLILKRTTKGPHRDDFEIHLHGLKTKNFASQGQKKSLLFSADLALARWLTKEKDSHPILILDDVFDKLDPIRSFNLLEYIFKGEYKQIFLSDAHPTRLKEYLESLGLSFGYLHLNNHLKGDEEGE